MYVREWALCCWWDNKHIQVDVDVYVVKVWVRMLLLCCLAFISILNCLV